MDHCDTWIFQLGAAPISTKQIRKPEERELLSSEEHWGVLPGIHRRLPFLKYLSQSQQVSHQFSFFIHILPVQLLVHPPVSNQQHFGPQMLLSVPCDRNEKQHLCLSAMKEVPGGAEVSQWFGDDSSLEAFLYKALQHRIGVWHIQVNVWDFTVNPFIALQCQDSNNHWVTLWFYYNVCKYPSAFQRIYFWYSFTNLKHCSYKSVEK